MSSSDVRIPDDLQEQVRKLSEQQKRSVDEVVCDSLRRYIAQEELRQLREDLRPHAEARGILTDDDVFKAVS